MRWVLSLLMVALLSGCTGSPVENVRATVPFDQHREATDTDELPDADETTLPTEAPAPREEAEAPEPLAALLSADSVNGTTPLNVTFALSATGADLANATWSLAVEGNGTTVHDGTGLPASVAHAFLAPGTFDVTLTVTDAGASASASLQVSVLPPAGPAFFQDATDAWTASMGGATEFALGCYDTTTFCGGIDLREGAAGRAFTATFSSTVPAAVYYIDHYAGGTYVVTTISPANPVITGTVPDDITHFRFYATGGAQFTVHLVIL